MALDRAFDHQPEAIARAQAARVAEQGCDNDPHLVRLLQQGGPRCGLDLTDAIHLLCALHGQYPGLIALAAHNDAAFDDRDWLARASESFEDERAFLLKLTSAVGPIPGTPGAPATEASLLAMRHALETLAGSERAGCALGAACALIADWSSIRRVLDRAAMRNGLDVPACMLPEGDAVLEVIGQAARSPAVARAMAFGSEQLLLQHRALFALLEARSEARSES